MFRDSKLKSLERKVASAISIVTRTITDLEKTNQEYAKINEEIDAEISNLTDIHMANHGRIKENSAIIENFKKLLK